MLWSACTCRDKSFLLTIWRPRTSLGLQAARQSRPQADSLAVPAEPAALQLRREVSPELTSYDHRRAHFLAMCMKLVYERPACIEDIAQSRWELGRNNVRQTLASFGVEGQDLPPPSGSSTSSHLHFPNASLCTVCCSS